LLAAFVYPIILACTWGQGWLFDEGFKDFAGTGIIHMASGVAGFWGALIVGERSSKVRARLQPPVQPVKLDKAVKRELADPNADFSEIAQRHFKINGD
jgi:ammonia channel protein AmtB